MDIFSFSTLLFMFFTWFLVYRLFTEVIEICFCPQILDCALGHNESALFRRAQLKALVSIHSQEVTFSYHSALEVFMFNQGYVTVRISTITGWQGWRAYSWWDYNHKRSLGPDRKGVLHFRNMWPIFTQQKNKAYFSRKHWSKWSWHVSRYCYTYFVK